MDDGYDYEAEKARLEATCERKTRFTSPATARSAADDMRANHPGLSFHVYRCHMCHVWHVGKTMSMEEMARVARFIRERQARAD